jgi:hypothetical protein
MEEPEISEAELVSALVAAIEALPDAAAHIVHRNTPAHLPGDERREIDALLHVGIAGRQVQLLVEVKREAFPRDVRELLWQFRNYAAHLNPGTDQLIPFIAARSISRGARELLREENVGFYDLGGSLFIPGRDIYVLIDRPPPKRTRRILSIFEGQKARTIITLFAHGDQWVGVSELAELAQVSPATASATLSAMEQHDWVDAEGAGPSKVRRLRNPKALLDEWAAYVSERKPPKGARYYVPAADAETLCRKLDHVCRSYDLPYAVTGEAAAQLYAPYLSSISQVRCRMAPGQLRNRALDQMSARPVSEGWNLAVIESKGTNDIIVGDEIGGVALAPPLQVYLDLLQGSGRAKEMAAHLRERRLLA